jgi:DNA-binding CsgD family transcriptional regulator
VVSLRMSIAAADRLNDGQRDCLRLVLAHHNSKEIARQLGVSPHTVDQRLRTAMRILNVQSRFEAAREFAAIDVEDGYQPLIYQMSDVEPPEESGRLEALIGEGGRDEIALIEDVLKSEGNGAEATFETSQIRSQRLPIPRYRGEKNYLGTVERMGWILAIVIGSALSFGGLIAGLEALSRLKG